MAKFAALRDLIQPRSHSIAVCLGICSTSNLSIFTGIWNLDLIYGYVTITAEDYSGIEGRVDEFMDRLQTIHPLLPLRVVPLKIFQFSPTKTRTAEKHMRAIEQQSLAAVAWKKQLNSRFSTEQLETRISDINLYS